MGNSQSSEIGESSKLLPEISAKSGTPTLFLERLI